MDMTVFLFVAMVRVALMGIGVIKTFQQGASEYCTPSEGAVRYPVTEQLAICVDCWTHAEMRCGGCQERYCGCGRGAYCSECRSNRMQGWEVGR
jgi:hypothetical protein